MLEAGIAIISLVIGVIIGWWVRSRRDEAPRASSESGDDSEGDGGLRSSP